MTYSYTHGVSKNRIGVAMVAILVAAMASLSMLVSIDAGAKAEKSGTAVPGHSRTSDSNDNGSPDAGVWVNGHYTSVYAYDANGDYYWDLGDGRIYNTVDSVEDLDQETLTVCDYVVNYRADFGDTPYMDQGSIHNNIKCSGEEKGTYNSVIVSDQDPRYTGNSDLAIWGNWEYIVDTWSGTGNVANPMKHSN